MKVFHWLFKYPLEDFKDGVIRFASGARLELVAAVVLAAVAGTWYLYYRRSPGNIRRVTRASLWALRGLVLGLLVLILFHLVLRLPLPQTSNVFLAVLVDDSRSMRIQDAGPQGARTPKAERKSRLDVARELLGQPGDAGGKPGLLNDLAEVCPVRLFKFAGRAERIRDMQEVAGSGDRTNLSAALSAVESDLRGVPVAGVVLVTDGAANAGGSAGELAEVAREMKLLDRPLYCVGLGDARPPRDYEVISVQAPREVRANTDVDVFASIRAGGFTDPFEVVLRSDADELARVVVAPVEGVDIYRVRLGFQPTQKGTFRYNVQVPAAPEEVILDNNRYDFLVNVTDKRLPVLYLEGSPREEYRFLRRALFRDKDFRVVGILRLDGPKRYILQGAEKEDALAESDKEHKENGYPKTEADLDRFEAVILGDIEAGYLDKKQWEFTEKFVRERGGGFLMLGGVNSFNLGGYQGTPIERMLPVVLPGPAVAYQQVEFNIEVTDVGLKHPIMQQSSNPLLNRNYWSKAPTLIGFNPIAAVKPGAQTLAVNPKTGAPVLAVQNYGAGRSAAFTSGGSWHWQMALPQEDELHEKFWKQVVRWLAVGAKANLTVELNKDIFPLREPVHIRGTVLNKVFEPDNDAKVVAVVIDPFDNRQELALRCILTGEGVYDAQYEPLDVGDYKVQVTATLADQSQVSRTVTFSVGETLEEFSDPGQKTRLLTEIARLSGGRYVPVNDTGELPREIERRVRRMKTEQTVHEHKDIWDAPLIFALIAAALAAEWFIRRRAGLM